MKKAHSRRSAALTVIELLAAASIGSMAMAAMFSGVVSVQRRFVAAEDYALAKVDQARLSDYLALDLRRAFKVTAGTDGRTLLTLQIPDYYDGSGLPRTPTITKYVANYGDPAHQVTIVYRKAGSSLYREEVGARTEEIATNVQDFQLSIQDLGKVVKTQVTFAPSFQRIPTVAARTATTVFNTTLLRNTRKDQ